MYRKIALVAFLAGLALFTLAACAQAAVESAPTEAPASTKIPAPTEEAPTAAPTEVPPTLTGDPMRGGRLYDKWMEELGTETPAGDQPLWVTQSSNTRTGTDTWRCKECHGWDYKGVAGAYGSGSHKTGFIGVMGVAGKDPAEILPILKGATNPDHDFSAFLAEQDLIDLALFLSAELMDYAIIVNADKSLVMGNADEGKTVFADNCVDCHGPQGLALNFGGVNDPEYQGTIATDNPWEFLHKLRFGQPAAVDMPSMDDDGYEVADFANVLAYVATFPTESPLTDGGVLYDNWMKAMGVDPPATDQPLWVTQSTNTRTGADTWRCKECHGWDYKGVDGAYGSGSHKTGFTGLMKAATLSAEELTAWLDGSKNPDHNFTGDGRMGETQVKMMVAFLQGGLTDTSEFINADGTLKGGDAERGKEIFNWNCASCHGEDGKTLNFGSDTEPEYIGTIGVENPWEFVHKASVGQPAAPMPSGLNLGFTLQDIIDLLAYTQSLPVK